MLFLAPLTRGGRGGWFSRREAAPRFLPLLPGGFLGRLFSGRVRPVGAVRDPPLQPSFRRKPESILKQNDNTPAFHFLVIGRKQSENKKQRQNKWIPAFAGMTTILLTPASKGRAAERQGFRNIGKRDKGVVGTGRDLSLQFLISSLHSRRYPQLPPFLNHAREAVPFRAAGVDSGTALDEARGEVRLLVQIDEQGGEVQEHARVFG